MLAAEPSSQKREHLLHSARQSRKQACAPCWPFKAGAALLVRGCNVENASCGLSDCAECTAIFSAVAETGPGMTIAAIAGVNDQGAPGRPRGTCRRVIYGSGPQTGLLFLGGQAGKEMGIAELLPEGFRRQ
jgi:cytidine deaminase